MKSIACLLIASFLSTPVLAAAEKNQKKLPQKVKQVEKKEDLTLKDLGFSNKETKGDVEKQGVLETRAKKLKTHQTLGLVTLALMTATVLTAEEHRVPPIHKTLGITTGVSYFTTAYFSLSAPEVEHKEPDAWNVKLHKALAWVHFPLMVLTPIAGLIAEKQIERGEDLHGLAKYKQTLGIATIAAFAPAAALMVFDF